MDKLIICIIVIKYMVRSRVLVCHDVVIVI